MSQHQESLRRQGIWYELLCEFRRHPIIVTCQVLFGIAILIGLYIGPPQPNGPTPEELAELEALKKKMYTPEGRLTDFGSEVLGFTEEELEKALK